MQNSPKKSLKFVRLREGEGNLACKLSAIRLDQKSEVQNTLGIFTAAEVEQVSTRLPGKFLTRPMPLGLLQTYLVAHTKPQSRSVRSFESQSTDLTI